MSTRICASVARLVPIVALAASAGCPGKAKPLAPAAPQVTSLPPTTIAVGDCGVPEHDGVVSATPRLRRADQDLDGDGHPEAVVADEAMCDAQHNCYWNVFLPAPDGGCARFAGVLPGQSLQLLRPGTGGVPAPVRAVWQLAGGRVLMQEYQFRRGGYALVDTLVCRREDDDRVLCAEDAR
ncbi:MAG TPA: hypothetical protein VHE35_37380 [Kofleriaceae bacterium]|nr:hypothetical protein [Kofleriaceae bacterium]